MDQRRIILLGALLLTALAASFHWYGESGDPLADNQQEKLKQFAPEAIVRSFQQTIFDELGIRQYQMEANTVTHYSMQSAAEMAAPIITFYKKADTTDNPSKTQISGDETAADETDWVAKAKTGIIQDNGDTLVLSGDVNVTKPISNQDPLTFNTESLLIMPDKEIAKTNEPVTLKQALHVTKAKGLVIDIKAGKIELSSQVRSQYVPATL